MDVDLQLGGGALDQVVLSLLQAKDAGEEELRGLERLIAAARKRKASRGDGASRFQIFRYVTLPALRPSITIVLILSIINSLKAFDIVYGMTQGGPAQSTQMLALWAFTQAMQLGDFGRGAAISVVLLLVTTAIVVPYLRWMRGHRELVA